MKGVVFKEHEAKRGKYLALSPLWLPMVTAQTDTLAIVGRQGDPTGSMYAAAAVAIGVKCIWVDVVEALSEVSLVDGPSLFEHSHIDVHGQRFDPTSAYLAESARLRSCAAVIDVSYEYQPFIAALHLAWNRAGLRTANSPQSVVNSQNKWLSNRIVADYGIPTPLTHCVETFAEAQSAAESVGFPVVLKELSGTQGVGVRLAQNHTGLRAAANDLDLNGQPLLLQEYVESSATDYRILMVDYKVVAAMRRVSAPGEFRANLARGGTGHAVGLTDDEVALAVQVAQVLHLNLGGLDFIYRRGRAEIRPSPVTDLLFLEANSSPGLAGIRAASGINAAPAILRDLLEQT